MAVNNEVLALILGGGQGSRLFPLTHHRSKPAVPIGGQYRLIDIPIIGARYRNLHMAAGALQRTFPESCSLPAATAFLSRRHS